MMTEIIFVLLFITTIIAVDIPNVPQVQIPNGLLQGVYEKSYNGRTFSSFEGIPYARPPVGELRFEPPKEPYNWTGIWIANTKHTCLQTMFTAIIGDEDCLYLNVYTPRKNPNSSDNLKVIVHIHGGGFSMWSGHAYAGPKYLMDEEVVVVTMNYRLGPFGFLSTQDEVVPGNNGLKDQALSLQWIQKNIKYFGGNPDSVTITGMSAGAGSVHLHYFSSLSKGTFHRGVSQSGNALAPWAVQHSSLKAATALAQEMGCPTKTSREMIDCLKSRSGIKITEALKSLESKAVWPLLFLPVIEPDHDGAFLSQHPYKMMFDKTVADIPWIVSVAEREGLLVTTMIPKVMPRLLDDFEELMPHILLYHYDDVKVQETVTDKVRDHYFVGNNINVAEITMDMIADRFFLAGANTAAKLQAKANKSPVYFMKFGYRGEHSIIDLVGPKSTHADAAHGDDVQYYLHSAAAEEKLSPSDEKVKSIFMQWLLSFAETGEPKIEDIEWKPVSGGDELEYLYFKDGTDINLAYQEDFGSSNFWSNLPLKDNEIRRRLRDEL